MKKFLSTIVLSTPFVVGLLVVLTTFQQSAIADEGEGGCVKPGKATIISGTIVCDCTSTAASDCNCNLPAGNCPPLND